MGGFGRGSKQALLSLTDRFRFPNPPSLLAASPGFLIASVAVNGGGVPCVCVAAFPFSGLGLGRRRQRKAGDSGRNEWRFSRLGPSLLQFFDSVVRHWCSRANFFFSLP